MKVLMIAVTVIGVLATASFGQVDTVDMNFEFISEFDIRDVDPSNFQGSFFYLNDSINAAGNLLAGQIGWGAWEIDRNGNVVNTIRTNQTLSQNNDATLVGTPPIGAKSVVPFQGFNFIGANNHAGIARFTPTGPNPWDPDSLTGLTNPPGSVESITTNGTRLFTNESTNDNSSAPAGGGHDTIHAYSLINVSNTAFTLNEVWRTDIGNHPDVVTMDRNPPRFRGVAFGDNGFVYGVDTGNGGQGSVWAFDVTDGTATKVTDYVDPNDPDGTGTSLSFLGEPFQGFGAIVHQDELFVVGTGGVISVFELTTPTTVGARSDFDIGQALLDAGAAESTEVALYGIAIDGDGPGGGADFMWLSYESAGESSNRRVVGFELVNPEPSTLGLLAGALCLIAVGRRRRAAYQRPIYHGRTRTGTAESADPVAAPGLDRRL